MKSFKKYLALTFLLLGGSLFGFSHADAATLDSFKEPVGSIFVEIPYKKSDVVVEHIDSGKLGVEQINVYDKVTNELITEISVEELASNPMARAYNLIEVSQSTGTSYGKAFLKARLNVYSSGSFREIAGVNTTWWEASSGLAMLEQQNSDGISTTGKFPTTKVQIAGAATLTATINAGYTAGFEGAGFSISGGANGNYYARKNVSMNYNYSLY